MIKKETILSVFDKKLTLLEYLKEIKKGLEDSAIESFSCDQVDETHIKFALNFADGTKYETDEIEVQQGPQGETGATPQIEVSASAETLEPNESATASVTQGGTPEAPTIAIAFGIPKGKDGTPAENIKVYLHYLYTQRTFSINVTSTSITPLTTSSFAKWLYDNGYTSFSDLYPINFIVERDNNKLTFYRGVYSSNGTIISVRYYEVTFGATGITNWNATTTSTTISNDTVIEM